MLLLAAGGAGSPRAARRNGFQRPPARRGRAVVDVVSVVSGGTADASASARPSVRTSDGPTVLLKDAQPIRDDIDGLVAVGSAALGDAVDEVGEIADALARAATNFKGSNGARQASMHMGTASEALTDLVRIAQAVADTLTSQKSVTETALATSSRFRPPGASISQAITNAAAAAFISALRALAIVLRDVLLSPEVSEHTAKAVRDGAKAAGAFGRAALQRLDGRAAERVRTAERQRADRSSGPEGDVVDPQWVQKRLGAFGNEEIVDSSRKRQRREQRLRDEERAQGDPRSARAREEEGGGGSAQADGSVIDVELC